MNAELLDRNYAVAYPEELDGTLDVANSHANICKFNRVGTLIAIGSNDGRIFLFDFITRGLVKSWSAHVKPISSLDWSRSGAFLLSASADSSVAIWNVADSSRNVKQYHYGTCVTQPQACFNPRNEDQFVVLTLGLPTASVTSAIVRNVSIDSETRLGAEIVQQNEESISAITYEHSGAYILIGTTKAIFFQKLYFKGRVILYDSKTLHLYKAVSQTGNHSIRNFLVSRRGGYIMTNCVDRVVRCYRFEQLKNNRNDDLIEPIQRFQDMVNKTSWKSVCASNEGDYVCGASIKSHSLHLWERNSGNLIKILNGAKGEMLTDVQWHPNRPVILSLANGVVSIWTQAHVENWSAFAPDFVELEDNRKYDEKEVEFDNYDEDSEEFHDRRSSADDDELEVDVTGLEAKDLGSSDEEEYVSPKDFVWFIPISSDADQVQDLTAKYENRNEYDEFEDEYT